MKKALSKRREKPVDWEKQYKTSRKKLWAKKPHAYSRLATTYVKKGRVLDIGSGEGYDCLFFAQKGFAVNAMDISRTAVNQLLATAKKHRLPIHGIVGDVCRTPVKKMYDVVVSYGALQFLGSKFPAYLKNIKKKTKAGGVNAFYVFGNKGDFYDLAKHRFYFPSEKELKELYADWKIVKFQKKRVRLLITGDKGEALYNTMFKILARKVVSRSRLA